MHRFSTTAFSLSATDEGVKWNCPTIIRGHGCHGIRVSAPHREEGGWRSVSCSWPLISSLRPHRGRQVLRYSSRSRCDLLMDMAFEDGKNASLRDHVVLSWHTHVLRDPHKNPAGPPCWRAWWPVANGRLRPYSRRIRFKRGVGCNCGTADSEQAEFKAAAFRVWLHYFTLIQLAKLARTEI